MTVFKSKYKIGEWKNATSHHISLSEFRCLPDDDLIQTQTRQTYNSLDFTHTHTQPHIHTSHHITDAADTISATCHVQNKQRIHECIRTCASFQFSNTKCAAPKRKTCNKRSKFEERRACNEIERYHGINFNMAFVHVSLASGKHVPGNKTVHMSDYKTIKNEFQKNKLEPHHKGPRKVGLTGMTSCRPDSTEPKGPKSCYLHMGASRTVRLLDQIAPNPYSIDATSRKLSLLPLSPSFGVQLAFSQISGPACSREHGSG